MVGHTTYLGMYDRKDDLEKLQLYLEVEPSLQINFPCHTYMKDDAPTRPPFCQKKAFSNLSNIRNLKQFGDRMAARSGFILITDHKKGHKIHKVSCSWLKAESFAEKVINKHGVNGSYYWCDHLDYLIKHRLIRRCKYCIRTKVNFRL